MKKMKKVMALLLSLVMVLAMSIATFATEGSTGSSTSTTITIQGGADGSVYSAYKLMDVSVDAAGKNFTYTVNSKYSMALQVATKKGTDAAVIKYLNDNKDNEAAIRDFADFVYKYLTTAGMGAEAESSNNVFTVDKGYYLIAEKTPGNKQDTYSLVMLNTLGNDSITINTKESTPTLEKKIKEKNDSTGKETDWQDGADYDLGDVIPFKLTGTVSSRIANYTTYYYAFHDKMSAGLTFNDTSVEVTIDGTKIDKSKYSVKTEGLTDGCTFEVVFDDLKKAGVALTGNSKVVVEYKATLNEKAVLGSVGNPNDAKLEYNNNPYYEGNGKPENPGETPWDGVIVFTYKLVANKVDQNGASVNGAGFTLYKYNEEIKDYKKVGEEIKGTDDKPVTTFEFSYLDAGKYKLVESTIPAGYSAAPDLVFEVRATYTADMGATGAKPTLTALEIIDENGNTISGEDKVFTTNLEKGSAETDVVNKSGSTLPTTGGMGTTIFYVVGSILVLGAAILLITKKRMSAR